MHTVSLATGPVHPAALGALQSWLRDNHYSVHAIDAVIAHAAEEGTPTGSPYLDPEDEAAATEAFVAAMPAVSGCSNDWDDPSIYLDVDTLLEAGRPRIPTDALVPPELDPEPYAPTEEEELFAAAFAAADAEPGLPPIVGGAPFVPGDLDWAEYRAWCDRLDRLEAEGPARDTPGGPVYGYE